MRYLQQAKVHYRYRRRWPQNVRSVAQGEYFIRHLGTSSREEAIRLRPAVEIEFYTALGELLMANRIYLESRGCGSALLFDPIEPFQRRRLVHEGERLLGCKATFATQQNADQNQPQMALREDVHRISCVVDGDTIWVRGEKIRIADIDTPGVGELRCNEEYRLGMRATYRLRDVLNEGP